MIASDNLLRAKEVEAYEGIPSLDQHGDLIRLILAEASLLVEKYRYVQRHDVPHIRELGGLFGVLWQEIEMSYSRPALAALDSVSASEAFGSIQDA